MDQPLFLIWSLDALQQKPTGNAEEQNYYSQILKDHLEKSRLERQREHTDLVSGFIRVQRWGGVSRVLWTHIIIVKFELLRMGIRHRKGEPVSQGDQLSGLPRTF